MSLADWKWTGQLVSRKITRHGWLPLAKEERRGENAENIEAHETAYNDAALAELGKKYRAAL